MGGLGVARVGWGFVDRPHAVFEDVGVVVDDVVVRQCEGRVERLGHQEDQAGAQQERLRRRQLDQTEEQELDSFHLIADLH